MPWYHKPFVLTIINAPNGLGSFFHFLKSDSKIINCSHGISIMGYSEMINTDKNSSMVKWS